MEIVYGELVIACEGFCAGSYHAKCVGLTKDEKVCCLKNPCIFWICTSCSTMLREIRYSDNMQAKFKLNSSAARSATEECDAVKHSSICESSNVIAEIKSEIASIQKTLADLTASRPSVLNTTTDELPLAHSSPTQSSNSSQQCYVGNRTNGIPRQIGSNHWSMNCNDKFWLFFSRVKNDVTEDEIRAMVTECLGITDSISVQKLVSSWMDAAQLPYISFKVGIDVCLRDRAMWSPTWPNGVWFREFKERCFTWEPRGR